MHRRDFIARSSAALAGLMVPDILKAESPVPAKKNESDGRIRVGLIGCRSMGWGDYAEFFKFPEADCVALCDIDEGVLQKRAADFEDKTGKKPKLFSDYRKMLADKDIDAVVIGTPDHWHCLMTCDALAAGKHVYVEKPLANTIAECEIMEAYAQHYGKVVQVGQQQRSGLIWQEMKKYLDSGRLGRIAKVNVWANFSYASILNPVQDSTGRRGLRHVARPCPSAHFQPEALPWFMEDVLGLWRRSGDRLGRASARHGALGHEHRLNA